MYSTLYIECHYQQDQSQQKSRNEYAKDQLVLETGHIFSVVFFHRAVSMERLPVRLFDSCLKNFIGDLWSFRLLFGNGESGRRRQFINKDRRQAVLACGFFPK